MKEEDFKNNAMDRTSINMHAKINAYKILAGNVEGKNSLVRLEAAQINF